jgi:hypothetical protein
METGFIVVYVGSAECGVSLPLYNIGERLKVTEVTVSSISGTTYYAVTDGRTSGAWYDAKLFKRLDDIRAEILDEIGI